MADEHARDAMRRWRANLSPEARAAYRAKATAARNALRWVKYPEIKKRERPLGQCTSCSGIFPKTKEFFRYVNNGSGRITLSAECRACQNKRRREWHAENKARDEARGRLRRERRGNPPWANHNLMESLYEIAAALTRAGHPHHVDHIYPLIHPRMCGLHVPWNLRVVPTALNRAKGNRVPLDNGVVHDCSWGN